MANLTLAATVTEFIERGFNHGDLSVIEQFNDHQTVDHQEPPGTDFVPHLKAVITSMRTAFPDLHFEIQHVLEDGPIVALHSTMTGTHLGVLNLGQLSDVPPTGRSVNVRHMHFLRFVDGKATDLWHVWETPKLLQQLGLMPERRAVPQ